MNRKGNYVNLSEDKAGNLVITLNWNGAQYANSLNELPDLPELLEDHLCNGLDMLQPEQVGALTDSVILSDCAIDNDMGEIIQCDYVWWFPNYQVENPVETLYSEGRVVFTRQNGETD
jgi:hypothetical protein